MIKRFSWVIEIQSVLVEGTEFGKLLEAAHTLIVIGTTNLVFEWMCLCINIIFSLIIVQGLSFIQSWPTGLRCTSTDHVPWSRDQVKCVLALVAVSWGCLTCVLEKPSIRVLQLRPKPLESQGAIPTSSYLLWQGSVYCLTPEMLPFKGNVDGAKAIIFWRSCVFSTLSFFYTVRFVFS